MRPNKHTATPIVYSTARANASSPAPALRAGRRSRGKPRFDEIQLVGQGTFPSTGPVDSLEACERVRLVAACLLATTPGPEPPDIEDRQNGAPRSS